MKVMNMVNAINNAIDIKLTEDRNIIVYGEDVGVEGGVFRVTDGLQKKHGADRVFVDTGEIDDARRVLAAVGENRLRHQVKIVFAGDISFEDLDNLKQLDLDFLDVGRAIVDAPLLDMRMVVEDN